MESRYIENGIEEDLADRMVFIGGPTPSWKNNPRYRATGAMVKMNRHRHT